MVRLDRKWEGGQSPRWSDKRSVWAKSGDDDFRFVGTVESYFCALANKWKLLLAFLKMKLG